MSSDNYTLSNTVGDTKDFSYVNIDDSINALNDIITAVKQENTEKLLLAMSNFNKLSGGEYELYIKLSNNAKSKLFKDMFNDSNLKADASEKDDIPYFVNIINNKIVLQAFNDKIIDSLDNYLKYICPLDYDKDIELKTSVNDYQSKLNTTGKSNVKSGISGCNFTDYTELRSKFIEQVILNVVSEPLNGKSDILAVFGSYNSLSSLNLTKFKGLSDYNQNNVLVALKAAKCKSITQLIDTFNTKVSEYLNNNPPGGGGGGGGGGTGSTVKDSYEIIPNIPQPDTDDTVTFKDLSDTHWARTYIINMYNKKIINGYSDNTLRPDNFVLREEAYKMFVSAFLENDINAVSTFTDVGKDEWYYSYIATAQSKGITNGLGEHIFGIGQNITRQDLAAMLYQYIKNSNIKFNAIELSFNDSELIAEYAKDAVSALCSLNIINGYEDNNFNPNAPATRAELAKMIDTLMSIN